MAGIHAITVPVCAGAAVAAVVLPDCLYGAVPAGPWALLAAMATGLASLYRPHQEILRCLLAIALGLTSDFLLVPSMAILSMCGSEGGPYWSSLFAHLRWFPATSATMLGVLILRKLRQRPGWRTLPKASLEFVAMLAVMSLAMAGLKTLAATLGWQWTAQGVACAMTLGMVGFMATQGNIHHCLHRISLNPEQKRT